jgi:hypothetical protein
MMGRRLLASGIIVLFAAGLAGAQDPVRTWGRLSDPPFDSSKFAAVEGIELVRDAIHIKLTSGVIQFAEPADGKVFGGAFSGRGRLQVAPPNQIERAQLKLHAKQETLDIEFTEAEFCFADSTFDEVADQVRWRPPTNSDLAKLYVERQKYREENGLEMLPRLFQAVLSKNPKPANYFAAELKTKNHGWMLVRFDPNELEQVDVRRWYADPLGPRPIVETWMRFPAGGKSLITDHLAANFKLPFTVDRYEIEASAGTKGELEATTNVHLKLQKENERVLLFSLNSYLRVESVVDSTSAELPFIQSRGPTIKFHLHNGDYVAVVMPGAEASGTNQEFKFRYAGKNAIYTTVEDSGIQTYGISGGWYPGRWNFYDYYGMRSRFQMTIRSPAEMTFLASGRKISESIEGDKLVTTWESIEPQLTAGFSYGDFKHDQDTFDSTKVDVYDNPSDDDVSNRMLDPKQARALLLEGSENLLHIVDPYFSNLPYKQISIVDNGRATAPGLLDMSAQAFLHLPSFAASRGAGPFLPNAGKEGLPPPIPNMGRLFMDASLRLDIGAGQQFAQQWWGQLVSPATSHDQWLFNGLSNFSGLLYVSAARNKSQYLDALGYYRAYLERIPPRISYCYETVGPVWLGGRLSSSLVPNGYGQISQNKGTWIIHMLRMMFWDPERKDPDEVFKAVLQDFATTFANRAASTEDFKAVVEKHMTPEMDIEHSRNMDWFFQQYVYGTGIPKYSFSCEKLGEEGGAWHFKCKITRTEVPLDWKDLLVVDQHENGKDYRLKMVQMNAPEVVFNLVLAAKPGRIHLADFDVLADFKQ